MEVVDDVIEDQLQHNMAHLAVRALVPLAGTASLWALKRLMGRRPPVTYEKVELSDDVCDDGRPIRVRIVAQKRRIQLLLKVRPMRRSVRLNGA